MGRDRSPSSLNSACILYALAAGLAAQGSETTDAAALMRTNAQLRTTWTDRWLHSDDSRQNAWGAWLARLDHQTNSIPLLLQKVTEYMPGAELVMTSDRDRHDAMLEVLDTLVQLKAAVPVKEAHKLYPEFAAQSLILLVRSTENPQSALSDIFDKANANWTWLAAGNVLLRMRIDGLAKRLLDRFTQHLRISVWDPGFGGGSGGGGSECGFSFRAPKAGWPPVGLYHLTQFPERIPWLSATFLVNGPPPVYYWRAEPGNYDNPPDARGSCDDGDRDRYRAQYLAKLLESAFPQISLDPYPGVRIEWRDESSYRQQLSAAVERQVVAFHLAVVSLQRSQLLTNDEATSLKPRLEIVVLDQRRDKSVPLPGFEGNNEGIAVRTRFHEPLP